MRRRAYSSSGSTGTGLYVSLNCEYSAATAGTSVPLLNGVESIGTNGGLTVQGNLSCTDSGTVNTWEAMRGRNLRRFHQRLAGLWFVRLLAIPGVPGPGSVRQLAGDVHPGWLRRGRRRRG